MNQEDKDENVLPEESGSLEEQEIASETDRSVALSVAELGGPMSGALGEIPASGIRGGAGMALLGGFARYVERNLEWVKKDLDKCRSEVSELSGLHRDEKEKAAVLTERLKGQGRQKILQNLLLTVGALTAGWGAQGTPDGVSWPAMVLGALLLLGGWLWPLGDGGSV